MASAYGASRSLGRPPTVRTCVRALGEPDNRSRTSAPVCRATPSRRSSATSTRPRPWTCASTRSSAKSALNRVPEKSRGAVPVDDQPVPGLLSCLRVLRSGRHADPHGGRADEAAAGSRRRRPRSSGRSATATTAGTSRPRCAPTGRPSSPPYRVTLEDGTELVTSGDHRFLTNRGWKHVTGAVSGAGARPHLTTANKLIGTGGFAAQPARHRRLSPRIPLRDDPRRRARSRRTRTTGPAAARLMSIMLPARAGGLPRRSSAASATSSAEARYRRRSRSPRRRPRLARDRARSAPSAGQRASGSASSSRGRCRRPTTGARASSPGSSTPRGRAAGGAADREPRPNSSSAGRVRRLEALRLRRRRGPHDAMRTGSRCVRIRGGLRERLRFFHLVDPAITRKRTVQGIALKSDARTASRVDRAARRGDAALRHHHRHRRLHRQRRRQPQLLRPPHPHLPRPERGARLREGDRRQGQRARGAAARAGAAVVEGRARRDGDEHRPVPVGRGALQAHARDLGGAAGRSQPLLDPHEVAARPA